MDINHKTRIPLFTVIGSLPFIIGVILWLASVDSKATAAKEQISEIKEMVIDTHDRVIRIEEHLTKHRVK